MKISREEIFGPVQSISKWSTMDEVRCGLVGRDRVTLCRWPVLQPIPLRMTTTSCPFFRSSGAPTTPTTGWRRASSPGTSTPSTPSRGGSAQEQFGEFPDVRMHTACLFLMRCLNLGSSLCPTTAAHQGELQQRVRRCGSFRRLQGALARNCDSNSRTPARHSRWNTYHLWTQPANRAHQIPSFL
jgi:hypothetical protein